MHQAIVIAVVFFWFVTVVVSVTVMLFARHVHDVYRDSVSKILEELGIGPLEIGFDPPT